MGQIFEEGDVQTDADVHHGDIEAHAKALAQHAGIDAALGAGALVEGRVRGAAQGNQLGGIAEGVLLLAEGEGGPLFVGGVGTELLLPPAPEGVLHIALGDGLL